MRIKEECCTTDKMDIVNRMAERLDMNASGMSLHGKVAFELSMIADRLQSIPGELRALKGIDGTLSEDIDKILSILDGIRGSDVDLISIRGHFDEIFLQELKSDLSGSLI